MQVPKQAHAYNPYAFPYIKPPVPSSGRIAATQPPDVFFGRREKDKSKSKRVSALARYAAALTLAGGLLTTGAAAGRLMDKHVTSTASASSSQKPELKPDILTQEQLLELLMKAGLILAALGIPLQNLEALRVAAMKLKNPSMVTGNLLGSAHPLLLTFTIDGPLGDVVRTFPNVFSSISATGQATHYGNENNPSGERQEHDFAPFLNALSRLRSNPADKEALKLLESELAKMSAFIGEGFKGVFSLKPEKDLLKALQEGTLLSQPPPELSRVSAQLNITAFTATNLAYLLQSLGVTNIASVLSTVAPIAAGTGSVAIMTPAGVRGFVNRKSLAGVLVLARTPLAILGSFSTTIPDAELALLFIGITRIAESSMFLGMQMLHSKYRALADALDWAREQGEKGMTAEELLKKLDSEPKLELLLSLKATGGEKEFREILEKAIKPAKEGIPLDVALRPDEERVLAWIENIFPELSKEVTMTPPKKKVKRKAQDLEAVREAQASLKEILEDPELVTQYLTIANSRKRAMETDVIYTGALCLTLNRIFSDYECLKRNGVKLSNRQEKSLTKTVEAGLRALAKWAEIYHANRKDWYIGRELPYLLNDLEACIDTAVMLFSDATLFPEPLAKAQKILQSQRQRVENFDLSASSLEALEEEIGKGLSAFEALLKLYRQGLQSEEIDIYSYDAAVFRRFLREAIQLCKDGIMSKYERYIVDLQKTDWEASRLLRDRVRVLRTRYVGLLSEFEEITKGNQQAALQKPLALATA